MSLLTSFSKTLNVYAKDKTNNKVKPSVLYISEALLSAIAGFVLALFISTFHDNNIIVYVTAVIGSYMGKNALNMMAKSILFIMKDYINDDNKK